MNLIKEIFTDCEAKTIEFAKNISQDFQKGDIIILEGDLGAGKTHFVKGFIQGFDSLNIATSPTFSIANFYKTKQGFDILHLDLYRIQNVAEFNNLGLSDYFNETIALIEWGKQFSDCFSDYYLITFDKLPTENCRKISVYKCA